MGKGKGAGATGFSNDSKNSTNLRRIVKDERKKTRKGKKRKERKKRGDQKIGCLNRNAGHPIPRTVRRIDYQGPTQQAPEVPATLYCWSKAGRYLGGCAGWLVLPETVTKPGTVSKAGQSEPGTAHEQRGRRAHPCLFGLDPCRSYPRELAADRLAAPRPVGSADSIR